jgi:hypothetical protein
MVRPMQDEKGGAVTQLPLDQKNNRSTRVVSVCTLEHADVWKLASQFLPMHIQADEFLVYVPDSQVHGFTLITNPLVKVVPESKLGKPFESALRRELVKVGNVQRFGWYYQQLLKIAALVVSPADQTVIWDADCIPVRPISLFSEKGVPLYMKSEEHHMPYFEVAKALLGVEKVSAHSFIVPGFPARKAWIAEFINELESKNSGLKWHDAIISKSYLAQQSGFSEFETLGTWVSQRKPGEWANSDYRWERFGQSRFGPAGSMTDIGLLALASKKNLDVISFENWDSRTLRTQLRTLWGEVREFSRRYT